MTFSTFKEYFENYRLTRQRLDNILDGSLPAERFDFLTLLFFIYSQDMIDENPADRTNAFLAEANQMLQDCGMYKVYLPNPYEAFVLLCLNSEFPLDSYAEAWEQSYAK